jgi:hypothetical protein
MYVIATTNGRPTLYVKLYGRKWVFSTQVDEATHFSSYGSAQHEINKILDYYAHDFTVVNVS